MADRAGPTPSARRRLAFLEALLASETLRGAAEIGAAWLLAEAGVSRAVVAIVVEEPGAGARLVGVGGPGVGDPWTVDLGGRPHPLARALARQRPTALGPRLAARLGLGSDAERVTAVPLATPGGGHGARGLLLYAGTPAMREVRWVTRHLARRLVDLGAVLAQGESRARNVRYDELVRTSGLLEERVRDATSELLRQNDLLHRQGLELEAASSAKSLFLANMSHELRTPLNAILGYTSMMLQGVSGPLPPNLTRQLTRIDSNGRHLLAIINDILDIARIEAGKMPFNPARFSVAGLVREVLVELDPLVVRSKLEVRAEISAAVPVLFTDRAKVKQILVNLVSNALKFTPRGSVTVSVQWHDRTKETWLSVADTGIGIAPADQEVVFQDFRQVDSSPTRPYGGTGLGLSICRRLAGVIGGDLRLASVVARGSTFTLVLPARARATATKATRTKRSRSATVARRTTRRAPAKR